MYGAKDSESTERTGKKNHAAGSENPRNLNCFDRPFSKQYCSSRTSQRYCKTAGVFRKVLLYSCECSGYNTPNGNTVYTKMKRHKAPKKFKINQQFRFTEIPSDYDTILKVVTNKTRVRTNLFSQDKEKRPKRQKI